MVKKRKGQYLDASDDMISEQGYLVARGVRVLALVGECAADNFSMLEAMTRIESLCQPPTIPFVIDRGDGVADCGVTGAAWALDLYRWIITAKPSALPALQRDRISGMLLGYSSDAIRAFEERASGRAAS
jgi:hypothetical protein